MLRTRPFTRLLSDPIALGFFFLFLGHLLAAYFSFGFHHPDEHFQILEFANYWVGLNPDPSQLRWEFGAEIRPWFQPMLHGVLMKAALWIGHYNPFDLAFLFRIIYGFFNIFSLWLLWDVFRERFKLNPWAWAWISLLWFFPYLHVRTSSENLSGIFLAFAFYHWMKKERSFVTGLLFGFAFLARYQIALGLLGMGLLLLWKARGITRKHLVLLLGFLVPVAIGTLLDRVGYGHWVFVPFRYFKVNLVDGVAASFNPYPWYQYFIWILQLNPLISLPLFVGTILFCRRYWKVELSAFVVTFFILHLFITNKEYRFLFPVMNLAPFMAVAAFSKWKKWASPAWLGSYALVSIVGFCISSLHGASIHTLWSIHMADRYSEPQEAWLSNNGFNDAFNRGYYRLENHPLIIYRTARELKLSLKKHRPIKVLVDGKLEDQITRDLIAVMNEERCKTIVSAYPLFLYGLRERLPFVSRLPYKVIYQCP